MTMNAEKAALIVSQTKKWIVEVVIGCNFCPFAAREIRLDTIHYEVVDTLGMAESLQSFMRECVRLDEDPGIATSLLIFSDGFTRFGDYLEMVALAEKLLVKSGYQGIYQVASFHPEYRFSKTKIDDPSNYTNRSIYPMLHLLREEQVEKALDRYPNPENIPANNIEFTKTKGELFMRTLRESCKTV